MSPLPMRLLAIAAAPADAEFSCGGTLARVAAAGGAIAICTLANGNSSAEDVPPRELAATLREEADRAAEALDAQLFWLDHSDFAVSNDAVTRLKLVDVLRSFRPDVVLAPAALGASSDVRNTWPLALDAVAMAAAPNARTEQPALSTVPYLLAYEPGWAAGFVPTEYVDIGSIIETKRAALAAYATLIAWRRQRNALDLPKAAETLAAYRGLQAGVPLAEAFLFDAGAGTAPTSRLLP